MGHDGSLLEASRNKQGNDQSKREQEMCKISNREKLIPVVSNIQ